MRPFFPVCLWRKNNSSNKVSQNITATDGLFYQRISLTDAQTQKTQSQKQSNFILFYFSLLPQTELNLIVASIVDNVVPFVPKEWWDINFVIHDLLFWRAKSIQTNKISNQIIQIFSEEKIFELQTFNWKYFIQQRKLLHYKVTNGLSTN